MSDTPRTDKFAQKFLLTWNQFAYRSDEDIAKQFQNTDDALDLARQLERELAEAKKDAERYRLLRDHAQNTLIGVYEWVERDGRQQRAWLAGNELDDVIDAAMKEGEK